MKTRNVSVQKGQNHAMASPKTQSGTQLKALNRLGTATTGLPQTQAFITQQPVPIIAITNAMNSANGKTRNASARATLNPA